MKKKVLLLVIASFLIAGVVSAASLWGNYKGNQIIRLTIDGDPVKVSDVPVISYQGRTMIPIYLLQQAGVKYAWDGKNQTVDIQSQTTPSIPTNNTDLAAIKNAAEKADFYRNLDSLGGFISDISDTLMDTYRARQSADQSDQFKKAEQFFDTVDKLYNEMVNQKNKLTSSGINMNEGNDILSSYKDALDAYNKAFNGMDGVLKTNSQADFNKYADNTEIALELAANAKKKSYASYAENINFIKNR